MLENPLIRYEGKSIPEGGDAALRRIWAEGMQTELVRGDIYEWGALMAGALVGSLPVVILYSFFVDYYVSSMTGAVKE